MDSSVSNHRLCHRMMNALKTHDSKPQPKLKTLRLFYKPRYIA
jgi:hypothetical protein